MAVQRGKDLLLKVDLTGDGQFETIAGLRATRISFNAEQVDVTSLESAGGWRELLAGAGVKSASISGSGVFRDENTDERARLALLRGRFRSPRLNMRAAWRGRRPMRCRCLPRAR